MRLALTSSTRHRGPEAVYGLKPRNVGAGEMGSRQKAGQVGTLIWIPGEIPNNRPAYLPRLTSPHTEAMQNS